MNDTSPLRQHPRCLLTELTDGTGVLLHLDSKFYYTLNETGLFVWKALGRGERDPGALVRLLCDEFDVDDETARHDIGALLDDLIAEGLVTRAA